MEQAYKNCQSCGIPLKKSPNGGRTNADGTLAKPTVLTVTKKVSSLNPTGL